VRRGWQDQSCGRSRVWSPVLSKYRVVCLESWRVLESLGGASGYAAANHGDRRSHVPGPPSSRGSARRARGMNLPTCPRGPGRSNQLSRPSLDPDPLPGFPPHSTRHSPTASLINISSPSCFPEKDHSSLSPPPRRQSALSALSLPFLRFSLIVPPISASGEDKLPALNSSRQLVRRLAFIAPDQVGMRAAFP
jgi:hypothetical protein